MRAEVSSRRGFVALALGALVSSVSAASGAGIVGCRKAPELPTVGEVPSFSLKDQTGKAVTSADYRGTVWIGDFIFTRCKESCPMLTARMKMVMRLLDDETKDRGGAPVKLVSFSVDPDHDTPERLAAYANPFGVEASRWAFLTGPTQDVRRIVSQGFKLGVTPMPQDDGSVDIVHSNRFVLVDKGGAIRGYYDAESPDEMKRLAGDAVGLSAAR